MILVSARDMTIGRGFIVKSDSWKVADRDARLTKIEVGSLDAFGAWEWSHSNEVLRVEAESHVW